MRPPGLRMRQASAMARSGWLAWCRAWLRKARSTVPRADGHVFQIAQAVFQVADVVLARQLRAELHHLFRIVDGDHLLGALRHELRERSLARAEVGDHHGRHELEERFGDALPGAAGHVLAAELAGQFVEVAAHAVLALAQDQAQRLAVLLGFGDFARRLRAAAPSARRGPSGDRRRSCRCAGRPPDRPISAGPGWWKPGSGPLPRISCSSATDSSSRSSSSRRRRRLGSAARRSDFRIDAMVESV